MELIVKTLGRLKAIDGEGRGQAVIATLNAIDKDGDVTMPGAFGSQEVKVVPAHDWQHVPIGKASLSEQGDAALADFALNLDISSARDWHSALKFDLANKPPLQEWSYGFLIEKASFGEFDGQQVRFLEAVKVHEISPVMVGAGVGTRTVSVKGADAKRATPAHSTETSDRAWDGPGNERKVRTGEAAGYYNRIYAWRDPEGDVGAKQTWRFIHHFVSTGGDPGAASTRACTTGIAVLNGARGGTTIPDADRRGVFNHLARHLRDADVNVPELRSADECAVKLADQIKFALWEVEAAVERCSEVRAVRAKEGRDLSADRLAELGDLGEALGKLYEVSKALDAVIRRGNEPALAERLLAEFLRQESRLRSAVE